jgi:hypothetical protein
MPYNKCVHVYGISDSQYYMKNRGPKEWLGKADVLDDRQKGPFNIYAIANSRLKTCCQPSLSRHDISVTGNMSDRTRFLVSNNIHVLLIHRAQVSWHRAE